MRKHIITFLAVILLAVSSCREKIDVEKEKAAIISVIEEEIE